MAMAQPNVLHAPQKTVITPRAALISTLRTWFLYRDEALWAFVSGTEAEKPLEKIVLDDDFHQHITEANAACERAWAMAEKIARETEQKTATVMREAVNELLASEAPRLLLSLSHLPGSF